MEGLDESQIAQWKETFKLFDKDGSGSISVAELGTVMRGLGQNPTDAEVEEMIASVDKNGTGQVEFEEFCNLMATNAKEPHDQEQEIIESFKVFDKDGSGKITVDELLYVMTNLGEKMTEEDAKAMISEADVNGDGMIDYKEYASMLTRALA